MAVDEIIADRKLPELDFNSRELCERRRYRAGGFAMVGEDKHDTFDSQRHI